MLRISSAIWRVDGAEPAAVRSDAKTWPPVCRGEARERGRAAAVVVPIAIASTVTPASLAAATAAESFVCVVSSPSVRTTSTFVSVGRVASSRLAWITES